MPQQTPLRTGDPKRVGRYRLVGRIAGIPADNPIFVAISPDGAHVAISMLRSDWAQDAAARDRFAAEAAVAKRVPPFCAARVLDAGVEGLEAYLVSEYVPGPSLLEVVVGDGVRAGPELEAVAIGMATGLAAVHQAGLVHGNFGPEYVIMASDGVPRVVEFGVTPPYGFATPAADMLAWAQTVVLAATGRPPAGHADVAVLPDPLIEVAARCLDPDPGTRPPARSVVLSLLGDVQLPAGVLAEGMRRASRLGPYAADLTRPRAGPRHSAAGPRTPRPTASRPAQPAPAQPAPGQPAPGQLRPAQPGPAQPGPAQPRPAPMAAAPRPGPPPLLSGQAGTARGSPRQGTTRPATADTGQRHHAPEHQARGRRAGLLAGAVVVLVVIVGASVFRLLQRGGSPGRSATSVATESRSPSASTSPSGERSPSATIPLDFAGTWSGVVRQPPTDTYHVSVGLKAGSAQGTVTYSGLSFGCSGVLSVRRAAATKLIMGQIITTGGCENGNVTISFTGADAVWFSFRRAGPIAAGKLTRS